MGMIALQTRCTHVCRATLEMTGPENRTGPNGLGLDITRPFKGNFMVWNDLAMEPCPQRCTRACRLSWRLRKKPWVHLEGQVKDKTHFRHQTFEPDGGYLIDSVELWMEARAGVEPTYTDLQSGA